MKREESTRWTIDELGAQTALALSVDYPGPPNDRVREVPDRRTIRYYTTLGLIDRPAEMRGRTAYYGRRHLLQLVAIKRLQADGQSLAEIQHRLLGMTDEGLDRVARLPAGAGLGPPPSTKPAKAGRSARRRSGGFWKEPPAIEAGEEDQNPATPRMLQEIRLGQEVTLLLAGGRLVDDDDLRAIYRAVEPLIGLLETRRLIRPREEGEMR
jgi:DNA-binding transcriptional MerR regulator